jgi:hypothetical protein
MDRVALMHEFGEAFSGVQRDPGQSLRQAHLTDQGISRRILTSEWREAGLLDLEQRWEDVPDSVLDECDAALSHFTLESWRFYLPAFMRRALALFTPPAYASEKLRVVLFHLTLTPALDPYTVPRLELLTVKQSAAVRHFIELVESEALALVERTNDQWWTYESAKNALDSYWRGE